MTGATTIIVVGALVLVLGVMFGACFYAMSKGINVGQPPGEGMAPGWVVRCPKCNFTVDAGKAGLIRIGARGNSRKRGWCQGCEKKAWLSVEPVDACPMPKIDDASIQCTVCGASKAAHEIGLIRLGNHLTESFQGACSSCNEKTLLRIVPDEYLDS